MKRISWAIIYQGLESKAYHPLHIHLHPISRNANIHNHYFQSVENIEIHRLKRNNAFTTNHLVVRLLLSKWQGNHIFVDDPMSISQRHKWYITNQERKIWQINLIRPGVLSFFQLNLNVTNASFGFSTGQDKIQNSGMKLSRNLFLEML